MAADSLLQERSPVPFLQEEPRAYFEGQLLIPEEPSAYFGSARASGRDWLRGGQDKREKLPKLHSNTIREHVFSLL